MNTRYALNKMICVRGLCTNVPLLLGRGGEPGPGLLLRILRSLDLGLLGAVLAVRVGSSLALASQINLFHNVLLLLDLQLAELGDPRADLAAVVRISFALVGCRRLFLSVLLELELGLLGTALTVLVGTSFALVAGSLILLSARVLDDGNTVSVLFDLFASASTVVFALLETVTTGVPVTTVDGVGGAAAITASTRGARAITSSITATATTETSTATSSASATSATASSTIVVLAALSSLADFGNLLVVGATLGG